MMSIPNKRMRSGLGPPACTLGISVGVSFDEPSSLFDSRTREVKLEHQTRADNARFFDSLNDVLSTALTQGIGTIMEAREIVLMRMASRKRVPSPTQSRDR